MKQQIYTLQDNKKLTVINLLGGPGVGKSILAARLFAEMAVNDYSVELVHESAKDFKWEDWDHIFPEQDYISAHQHRLIRRLVRHDVEYAVVDSSLLLAGVYQPKWYPESFFPFVLDMYKSYDNLNIRLIRNPNLPYKQPGRNESHDQALEKDNQVVELMKKHNIPYHEIMVGDTALQQAMEIVRQHHVANQR
jgi:nicotinamide riboside kinase